MNVIAYSALHYGKAYLGAAIRSVIRYVDTYFVLYAREGSHGSRTDTPPPDTRAELYQIARAAAGNKLVWVDGDWTAEGEQRDAIHEICPGADVVLVLDADEIWNEHLVSLVTRKAIVGTNYQHLRIPMIHFWRSFHRAILHDPAYPVRVIYPNGARGKEATYHMAGENGKPLVISHMGYAQDSRTVGYKLLVHGHRGQWRKDIDWFRDRFLANAQTDCHPVGSEYWNTEALNPLDYMPPWMAEHPYFKLEVIP